MGEVIKFPHVRRVRPAAPSRPADAARPADTARSKDAARPKDGAKESSRAGANRPYARTIGEGDTLCRAGFHKWVVDQKKQFDVKLGKLVTVRRCDRCGAKKTTLD